MKRIALFLTLETHLYRWPFQSGPPSVLLGQKL